MSNYPNGCIPASALVSVGNGQSMLPEFAGALEAMLDAYVAETGATRPVVASGYRSRADQQWQLDHPQGQLIAAVGQSTHGEGCTADLSDTGRNPVTVFSAWLDTNAATYGARRTIGSESWHYQFGFDHPALTALTATQIEEDDMTTYELVRQTGTPSVYFSVNRVTRCPVISEAHLADYVYYLQTAHGIADPQVLEVGRIESFGAIVS